MYIICEIYESLVTVEKSNTSQWQKTLTEKNRWPQKIERVMSGVSKRDLFDKLMYSLVTGI